MQTPSVTVNVHRLSITPHLEPNTERAVGTYGNVPECLSPTRRPRVSPGPREDDRPLSLSEYRILRFQNPRPLGSDPRQVLLSSGGGDRSGSSSPGTGYGVPSASSPSLLTVLCGSQLSSDWGFMQQVCTQHKACAGDQQGTSLSRLLPLPGR